MGGSIRASAVLAVALVLAAVWTPGCASTIQLSPETLNVDAAPAGAVHAGAAVVIVSPVSPLADQGPPKNLRTPAHLSRLVQDMWRRSPRFRSQCAQLAAAPALVVSIDRAEGVARQRPLASTRFQVGPNGLTSAAVSIGRTSRTWTYVELIAHELEHVIEQLDSVDLPALAGRRGAGVRRGLTGVGFETRRAIGVGREVRDEYLDFKPGRRTPAGNRQERVIAHAGSL